MITFPFSLGVPGGGTLGCIEIAQRLKQENVDVTVAPVFAGALAKRARATHCEGDSGAVQEEQLRKAGVNVRRVLPSRIHFLFDSLAMKRAVLAIHQERPLDGVLSWHHEGWALRDALAAHGIAFVMAAAGSFETLVDGRSLRALALRRVLTHSYRRADAVLAVSQYTRRDVIRRFSVAEGAVKVWRWGVSPEFADIPRSPFGSALRLIFFGAWIPRKGLFDALAALEKVAQDRPEEWEFRIAGWGDEAPVREAIRRHGLEQRVRILGQLNHVDLRRELAKADLAILPSYFESFGLAVAEALSSGLPVIAYDVGAVSEILHDGETGWLAPRANVSELTRAILEAIRQPARTAQMGLAGRRSAHDQFSWNKATRKLIDTVAEINGASSE